MTEYTIALALEDYLPVIFSSIGLFWISQMIGKVDGRLQQMAIVGWMAITLGGFFKATWKLVMAVTQTRINIVWMDKGLFLWLAVGFTLMAFALWYFNEIAQEKRTVPRIWTVPAVLFALILGAIVFTGFPDPEANTWRFILLGIMTLANVFMIAMLIQIARRRDENIAALLLLISVMISFVLSGLARVPDQTIPLQWTEQLLNTVSQAAFAYAVWTVYERVAAAVTRQQAVAAS